MSKRTLVISFALLTLLAGALLLLPGVRYPLVGWLRGEQFIAGKPMSYWNDVEGKWDWEDFRQLCQGGSDAVPMLVEIVTKKGDYYDAFRIEASKALVEMGASASEAVPVLAETFAELNIDSKNEDFRRRSGEILLKMGPLAEKAVPQLLPLLGKWRLTERHQQLAINILGAIGPKAKVAIPTLLEAVAWRGPDGRAPCMLLAHWQVDEAVPAIFKALEDSDASVATDWRVDALIELHKAGKSVLPHAITAVSSDDNIICIRATRLLARLGPDASPAIDALMKKTLEGKLHASENCLWALKHIGTEEAVQAIVNCMNATGREVDTLLELHKNGKPVLSKVVQGLSNSKKSIRWGSATLLGLMGTDAESSTVALQKLLQDEDKEVRQAASGALLKINPSTSKVNN